MDRVQRGDGGQWQIFVRGQEDGGSWWQVADVPDKCVYAVLGPDALYLLSVRDAPHGKVLRLPLSEGTTVAGAEEIVPAGNTVIEDLAVTDDTVWVVDMDGGPQQVRAFDTRGALPPRADPAAELGVVVPRWPFAAGAGADRLVARVLHRAGHLVGGGPRPSTTAHRAEDDHARRPVRVRGDTRVRDVQGRHPHPPQRDRRPRHAPGRDRAGAADRVRRLRPLAGAAF